MEYTIIIHPAEEGGFWTEVPALPGCCSQGETVEEAIQMAKDAIEGFLAYLRERGQEIPEEKDILIRVSVAA
ncbi:MAG: type II toxin-antitoxin system HicB family antitoxin [Dehalococcoidia bacterium]|nr:type II toxin-antitoxin system HicB family antitoxin [Dehalococcoidia bacterium]